MKTNQIAAILALGFAAACTTEIGDIDRTQPNVTEKALFQDGSEWYHTQTIIDVGYTQGWANVGESGNLEKITWEINQDFLIAYRAWEYIPGAEDKSDSGVRAPVSAFRIIKHFDIRRGYNSVTGSENNVIGENDFDAPWYDRKYMRVDWTTNHIDDFGINSYVWLQSMSPASYFVQAHEEQEANRPVISADYIDITSKYLAEPDWDTCIGVLDEHPEWCGGTTFTVRSSFKKIDKNLDYESWNYMDNVQVPVDTNNDGKDDDILRWSYDDKPCVSEDVDNCYEVRVPVFERFGFFRTEKLTYDKQRGITMTGRTNLIQRWNIWEKSYNGVDANGKRIVIPYAQRQPKPIIWYTNVDFPVDVMPAAQGIADDWNKALLDTVRGLGVPAAKIPERMYIVRRNDCNPDNVRAFVAKHPAVKSRLEFMGGVDALAKGNLEAACAVLEYHSGEGVYGEGDMKDEPKLVSEAFRWQKLGDLRFNQMVWQVKPVASSGYLGYAIMHADPDTGELVHANALVAGYYVDSLAARWLDEVDYANDTIDRDEVMSGEYITRALNGRRLARENRNRRAYGPATLSKLNERLRGMGQGRLVETPPGASDERLQRVKGTNLEREFLLTEEIKAAFAKDPTRRGMPLTAELAEKASPATWGTTAALKGREERRRKMSSGMGLRTRDRMVGNVLVPGRMVNAVMEPKELVDDAIAGLALKWKDLPREEAIQRIRLETYRAVGAHEVGHCMGLRHNFEASYDAVNWDDEFWHVDALPADLDAALALTDDQLAMKDERGNIEKAGALYRAEIQTCKAKLPEMPVGFDVNTQDCLDNQKHMYSSIMDYHRKLNSDWSGIGKYDVAAVKFGYGQLVEVFDESAGRFVPRDEDLDAFIGPFGRFDYRRVGKVLSGIPKLVDGVDDFPYDYGKKLDQDLTLVTAATDRRLNLRKRVNVPLSQIMAETRVRYTKATPAERNITGEAIVPFQFCPDEYADWSLTCQTFDLGGNMREVIGNIIDDYHMYYPFRNFKRDRFGWGRIGGYMQRLYERTFFPLTNMFRYYFYYSNFFEYAPMADYDMTADWTTGATVGLNFMAEILQTPEPGKYCKNGAKFEYSASGACASGVPEFDMPIITGKHFENSFTEEYVYKVSRIGVLYDKLAAIQALTNSEAFFYRDAGSYIDRRAFSISYYRLFREEMLKLFESLITGQGNSVAGRIVQDKDSGGAPIAGSEHYMPNLIVEEPSSVDYVEVAKVDPAAAYSYTVRYYGLLYGMAKMTSLVDGRLDFTKYIKVALAGTPEAVDYGQAIELAWSNEGGRATQCNALGACAGFQFTDSIASVEAALTAKGLDTSAALNPPTGPVAHDVYVTIKKYNYEEAFLRDQGEISGNYLVTGVSGSGNTVNLTLRTSFASGENTGDYSATPFRVNTSPCTNERCGGTGVPIEVITGFEIHLVRGSEKVSFTDPLSRYTYVSSKMDGDLGIGAHLIETANQLAAEYQTAKSAYDSAATADKATTFRVYEEARAKLAEQQELIDTVRQFHGFFEYGG